MGGGAILTHLNIRDPGMNTLTQLLHRALTALFAFGMTALILTACSTESGENEQNLKQELNKKLDELSDLAKEAKNTLIEEARKELDAVNVKIRDMEAKMDEDSEAATAEAQAALDKLKKERSDLQEALKKLESVTEEDWENVKSEVSKQIDESIESAEEQQADEPQTEPEGTDEENQ